MKPFQNAYDAIKRIFKGLFKKKGETSVNEGYKFYVLRQEKVVETMHHSISLYSDGNAIQLMQFFSIYDEELGTLIKENMDVPSCSMAFNCNFYLF